MEYGQTRHLVFLAKDPADHEHLKTILLDPTFNIHDEIATGEISHTYDDLCRLLSRNADLLDLLELHLMTEKLLSTSSLSAWDRRVEDRRLTEKFLPGLDWNAQTSGRWQTVPVLLSGDGRACCRYLVVGLASINKDGVHIPPWARDLMDEAAKRAVFTAAAATLNASGVAGAASLWCYPLVPPNGKTQLSGGSLGLPVALGFMALLSGENLPGHAVATGAIEENGGIKAVDGLEAKAAGAASWRTSRRERFEGLLYPAVCNRFEAPDRLDLLPVANLKEAWMFAQLYAPGKCRDLARLSNMLTDPEDFVGSADIVDPQWLVWLKREDRHEAIMDVIIQTPKRFSLFVDKVGWALKKGELEQAGAMAALIPASALVPVVGRSPLAALRFCTHSLALSNHRGDVEGADQWAEEGLRLFHRALKADINVCADFLNNRFVAEHNRYSFSPDLPAWLQAILSCMEARYAAQCAGGCMADKALGELYGSISQNFGFCGPDHLPECEACARKAMAAFAGGEVPELRDDWLRQLNYIAYAALDAKLHEKAEKTLIAYLEINDWDGLWAVFDHGSRWHHALVARFLAETTPTELHREYLRQSCEKKATLLKEEHPWQLWAFNLARVSQKLGEVGKSEAFYVDSLNLCMGAKLGPTVRVMGLLPLSGLRAMGRLSAVDLAHAKGKILESAKVLNQHYFRVLWEKDFETVLRTVWENPGNLFPFSYR